MSALPWERSHSTMVRQPQTCMSDDPYRALVLIVADSGRAMASNGAIPAIIGAMTRFPASEKIQQYGCLALGNLAINDGDTNLRLLVNI